MPLCFAVLLRTHFKAPCPPLLGLALVLRCLGLTLVLLCLELAPLLPSPGAEHPQLPPLHPCLSGPHKSCSKPTTLNPAHCPELSLSMTSMLRREPKAFPSPRHHHTVIIRTKTVSLSIVVIVVTLPLNAQGALILMELTLMRFLRMRMKESLKWHCMPQVCTFHFSNYALTILQYS